MADLKRCDGCKGLSDDQNIGYIGKDWCIKEYRNIKAKIVVTQDLCRNCVLNLVNKAGGLSQHDPKDNDY